MRRTPNTIRRATLLCATLILANILFPLGCSKKPEPETNTIKIGAVLPLTGDAAQYGISAKEGIDLAISMNQVSGTPAGTSFKVVYEDDQAIPKGGVSAFNKLLMGKDIHVVIGSMSSSVTLALAPIAERTSTVLISPGSSSPEITNAGDYIFRTAYSDVYEASIIAKYAILDLGLKSFGVLYVDNAYGNGFVLEFKKVVAEQGGRITASESFHEGATDFRTSLSKIKYSKPDGVLVLGYKEIGRVLAQSKELNLEGTFLSSVMFEDPDILRVAGGVAEGVYYSYPSFNPDSQDNTVKAFVASYEHRYNKKPDIYAALAYDAGALVCKAIAVGGNNADAIKTFLYSVKNYDGVTGNMSFDNNGDIIKDLGIKAVRNGEFVWVKEKFH